MPARGWKPLATVVRPAGGTPQPHAAIAVAIGPTGIATVSGWGFAVMTLLLLRAGTVILRRAMRRPQGAALHSLQL